MRHLIDSTDLSVAEIDRVLNLADDIIRDPAAYAECCRGKILATLFYEPSTRTRLSFEAAMLRLLFRYSSSRVPFSSWMVSICSAVLALL